MITKAKIMGYKVAGFLRSDFMSKKILVVDDEHAIVDLLTFNLKKEGYDVITANDGEEALLK